MSNLIVAVVAFLVVILGAYYVVFMISPSERDAILVDFDAKSGGAQEVFKSGVENVTDLLR